MRFYIVLLLNFCELTAVIAGLKYWKKVSGCYWKWFAIYLVVIFVVEMTGKFLILRVQRSDLNIYLYSFFGIPIQFLFFFWLFGRQTNNNARPSLPLISSVIYVVSWIVEYFYLKEANAWFSSFSYTVGNLLLVVLLIDFLLRFMHSGEVLNYKQSMMFWICVGLAIFYLGTLPFFALRNTLLNSYEDIFTVYDYIQLVLGCLMYLVFALSFVWGKPK